MCASFYVCMCFFVFLDLKVVRGLCKDNKNQHKHHFIVLHFFCALYFRFYFTVCLEWTPSISLCVCVWIWHVLQWNRKINYLWIWVHFYCKDMNFPQLSSVKFRQEVWQIFEKYPKRTRNFFVGISKCTIEIIETRQDL